MTEMEKNKTKYVGLVYTYDLQLFLADLCNSFYIKNKIELDTRKGHSAPTGFKYDGEFALDIVKSTQDFTKLIYKKFQNLVQHSRSSFCMKMPIGVDNSKFPKVEVKVMKSQEYSNLKCTCSGNINLLISR